MRNGIVLITAKADALRREWAGVGREGSPEVRVLVAKKPTEQDFAEWTSAGASELIWGVPDAEPDDASPTWRSWPGDWGSQPPLRNRPLASVRNTSLA